MSLAHAILAALQHQPERSGYELTHSFNSAVGQFWNASHQQIYRELGKMEAQGWLASDTISQSHRPNKKNYRITDRGKAELLDWLQRPVKPSPIRQELLVKLFAGALVPPLILQSHLKQYQKYCQDKLNLFLEIEKQYFQNPEQLDYANRLIYLTLRNGLLTLKAELQWLEEAQAVVQKEVHVTVTS